MRMKEELSLDDMLLIIAEHNRITQYNFVVYKSCDIKNFLFGYKTIDPKEGIIKHVSINVNDLSNGLNRLRTEALKDDYLVGITSDVMTKNGTASLILFDFVWDINEDNLNDISNVVREFTPGFLLESGQSYHFYSSNLTDKKKWMEILRGIWMESSVDANWTDLQERRGHSVLRVSTNSKKPDMPEVVAAMGYRALDPAQTYLFELKPKWPIEIIA